jgi:hypothetical protein
MKERGRTYWYWDWLWNRFGGRVGGIERKYRVKDQYGHGGQCKDSIRSAKNE